ncbi:MAG: polyisoprenoid-binding protein YceI [Ilumatobacter sp.]|jgi:polyisoprenoid-binding protein YceI
MNNPTTLPTGTWQLDTDATAITVSVKKLGLITVPATLTVTSGTIEIDDRHQVSNIEIVADASSYVSKNAKRDEHVHGADFLDVSQHPAILFHAATVADKAGGYRATGTITIKGQPSPMDVAITDVTVDGERGSFTATATVDRKAVGVDKMPTFIIGRDVELFVSASATKSAV